ncbi:DNA repair protein RecN [Aureibacter tunicatorum]|uniref:DNA repair protein RecN n=1 Tax=Aureibacter tunicatorum TaxID=866807 RepID=A0AAE4BRV9_9BACT|nr:DNA repair protein RecN [Aureibacter tunicatorum]MDR6237657.1 DNA repair protein RecN (Recombination protein N) [Aureibacter tunicatorum]BDD02692.1 DNA repair protein RecN [Aureibacter tunicatorum]
MITNLLIKNYALIQHLEIEPSRHLNIITGETGAGKSIMMGALGLLLGKRADTKVLYDSSTKCVIEGTFDISNYSLKTYFDQKDIEYSNQAFIRREIYPSGKSRAFINDTPVNLETLKALSTRLIDVHSQHDTLLLGSQDYQLEVIDAFAQNSRIKSSFAKAYSLYKAKERAFNSIRKQASELKKEHDYNLFLFNEFEELSLQQGELSELEQENEVMSHAEEIKSKLSMANYALQDGEQTILDQLHELKNALASISEYADIYKSLSERMESCMIELKDLANEIDSESSSVEFDPQRALFVQERLGKIYHLQQKHQVDSEEELIAIHEELSDKILRIENLDEDIELAEKERTQAYEQLMLKGEKLSESRTKTFKKLSNGLVSILVDLGMENSRLVIDHKKVEPNTNGIDEINLLFSANKGVTPQELKNVASGGEFSRLMFAVKYILADKTALPTIVFDEIDTGISGEIALKMVKMMEEMASTEHQLLVITHLPQIASKGQKHYFVYKDHSSERTISKMKALNHEERVQEIAQMIGGAHPSISAYESAKELLAK